MAIVYQHRKKGTDEVFYVGIGKTEKRAYSKRYRNSRWDNIVNKYDYDIDILFRDLSWEEACAKEIELIKHYGRSDLNEGSLVNMTDGGDGTINYIYTEEHRKKISEAGKLWERPKGKKLTEEHKRKISESGKGRKLSPEHKERLRLSNLGNPSWTGKNLSEEHKKKIGDAKRGKPRPTHVGEAVAKANSGRVTSVETRLKQSIARKGKPKSEEHKRKISESNKKRFQKNKEKDES